MAAAVYGGQTTSRRRSRGRGRRWVVQARRRCAPDGRGASAGRKGRGAGRQLHEATPTGEGRAARRWVGAGQSAACVVLEGRGVDSVGSHSHRLTARPRGEGRQQGGGGARSAPIDSAGMGGGAGEELGSPRGCLAAAGQRAGSGGGRAAGCTTRTRACGSPAGRRREGIVCRSRHLRGGASGGPRRTTATAESPRGRRATTGVTGCCRAGCVSPHRAGGPHDPIDNDNGGGPVFHSAVAVDDARAPLCIWPGGWRFWPVSIQRGRPPAGEWHGGGLRTGAPRGPPPISRPHLHAPRAALAGAARRPAAAAIFVRQSRSRGLRQRAPSAGPIEVHSLSFDSLLSASPWKMPPANRTNTCGRLLNGHGGGALFPVGSCAGWGGGPIPPNGRTKVAARRMPHEGGPPGCWPRTRRACGGQPPMMRRPMTGRPHTAPRALWGGGGARVRCRAATPAAGGGCPLVPPLAGGGGGVGETRVVARQACASRSGGAAPISPPLLCAPRSPCLHVFTGRFVRPLPRPPHQTLLHTLPTSALRRQPSPPLPAPSTRPSIRVFRHPLPFRIGAAHPRPRLFALRCARR